MITVKAFKTDKKGMYCDPNKEKHYYRVGKTYTLPKNKVSLCEYGFHASAHCDISETLRYYRVPESTVYCLVDIDAVEISDDKIVGNRMKILKKLNFDECISYDRDGKWCYIRALKEKDRKKIKKLEDAVIQKDKNGFYCCEFARDVKYANKERLKKAVILKDNTGENCFEFAFVVIGHHDEELLQELLKKDTTGRECFKLCILCNGCRCEET